MIRVLDIYHSFTTNCGGCGLDIDACVIALVMLWINVILSKFNGETNEV